MIHSKILHLSPGGRIFLWRFQHKPTTWGALSVLFLFFPPCSPFSSIQLGIRTVFVFIKFCLKIRKCEGPLLTILLLAIPLLAFRAQARKRCSWNMNLDLLTILQGIISRGIGLSKPIGRFTLVTIQFASSSLLGIILLLLGILQCCIEIKFLWSRITQCREKTDWNRL